MMGAKQMKFCGAVARALLIGVCESTQKTVSSESKRTDKMRLLLAFTRAAKRALEVPRA